LGPIAVAIFYDDEFPETLRVAAREGANILVVPSRCTDDRQGFSGSGIVRMPVPSESDVCDPVGDGGVAAAGACGAPQRWTGRLHVRATSCFLDGILAEGNPNQEMMVIGDLNMVTINNTRTTGTVLPLLDSRRTAEITARVEVSRI
jgi:predicted amidohydrolase